MQPKQTWDWLCLLGQINLMGRASSNLSEFMLFKWLRFNQVTKVVDRALQCIWDMGESRNINFEV